MLNKCIYKLPDKFQHIRKKWSKGKIYELDFGRKECSRKRTVQFSLQNEQVTAWVKAEPKF